MKISLIDIENAVAAVFGLSRWDLHAKTRCFRISHPRMIVFYLYRQHTRASYPKIAAFFGFHHTAVLTGCERLPYLLATDEAFALKFAAVKELIAQTIHYRMHAVAHPPQCGQAPAIQSWLEATLASAPAFSTSRVEA